MALLVLGDNAPHGGVSRPAAFPWPQQPDWKDGDEEDVSELGGAQPAGASRTIQVSLLSSRVERLSGLPTSNYLAWH